MVAIDQSQSTLAVSKLVFKHVWPGFLLANKNRFFGGLFHDTRPIFVVL